MAEPSASSGLARLPPFGAASLTFSRIYRRSLEHPLKRVLERHRMKRNRYIFLFAWSRHE